MARQSFLAGAALLCLFVACLPPSTAVVTYTYRCRKPLDVNLVKQENLKGPQATCTYEVVRRGVTSTIKCLYDEATNTKVKGNPTQCPRNLVLIITDPPPPPPGGGVHNDPHMFVEIPNATRTEKLEFDFHGLDGHFYCLVSDRLLQINVHMRSNEVLRPNKHTWVDAFGVTYSDSEGASRSISLLIDQIRAAAGEQDFAATYEGETILDDEGALLWKSPDGLATLTRATSDGYTTVQVEDLLEMRVSVHHEADPPIYFFNFDIKSISTSPSVHGVLGQMYAPGAVQKRLEMNLPEKSDHREYVEGKDGEYETTGLTIRDCSFNRFSQEPQSLSAVVKDSNNDGGVNSLRRLLSIPTVECHETGGMGLAITCK